MRPLPPEDHLELVKAHPLVDLLILRDLLVLFEFLVPLSLAHWRNDAMDGLPFGNGQPRLNQPRCPTNEDEGEKRGNHHIKPYAHPAAVFGSTWGNGRSMGQTRHCAHDLSIRPGHLSRGKSLGATMHRFNISVQGHPERRRRAGL